MPKANLRVLKSPYGPFHRGKCSVCGEEFEVSHEPRVNYKTDLLTKFYEHIRKQHPHQWQAKENKLAKLHCSNSQT
jgi:hypothetical protein